MTYLSIKLSYKKYINKYRIYNLLNITNQFNNYNVLSNLCPVLGGSNTDENIPKEDLLVQPQTNGDIL